MATKLTAIAFRTTLLYVILSGIWILYSDRAVVTLTSDPNLYVKLSTYKGWGFVLVTGTLLYFTLRTQLRRWNNESEARKRVEGELLQNQEHLTLVIENSDDVLIMQDRDGRYVHFSGPKQLGVSPGEVIGKFPADFHEPRTAAMILDRHRRVFETRQSESGDDLIPWQGQQVWFSTKVTPAFDQNGNLIGTVTVSHNITARKHYEEALRESEERFQLAAEGSNDGLWDWQIDSNETYFSPRWKRMLGYTDSELPNSFETWRNLVHPDDLGETERQMEVLFAGQGNSFEREFRMRHRDGHYVAVLSRGRLVRNENGKPVRFVGTHVDVTEHRNAETILKEKLQLQNQLAGIAETVPGMICSFQLRPDGSTCMPFATRMIEKLYGLRPEDVINDAAPVFNAIHPDDRDHVTASIAESARSLTPWHDEYRVDHPERGEIWIEGRSMPQRLDDGSILWHGFVTDITDRKQSEQRVQQAYESLAEAQRLAHVGSWEFTLGPNEELIDSIWWSDECYRVFGYEPGSVALTTSFIQGCILPADLDIALRKALAAVRNGSEFSNEYRIVWPDGSVRNVIEHAVIVREQGTNRAVKIVGTIRDVTERMEYENALRDSEQRFRSYVENAPVGVLVADENAIITDANPASTLVLGHPVSDLIGKRIRTLLPEEDWEEAAKNFQLFLATGRFEREMRVVRGDGEIIWVFLVAVALEQHRFLGYCVEITQRKRAEAQLRASLREKEVLLQEIHHRVKNNLQIVSSLLSLQSHQIADKNARLAFEESRHRVRSMALIHENLYRTEDLANIRFDEYIRVVSNELWRSFAVPGITKKFKMEHIVLELDKAVPCGLIVNELITNALKHAYPDNRQGSILIDLSRPTPTTIRLAVEDDGVGFPEGVDFRSMSSMGMSLVVSLADQLGGEASLDRSGGTRFAFVFQG